MWCLMFVRVLLSVRVFFSVFTICESVITYLWGMNSLSVVVVSSDFVTRGHKYVTNMRNPCTGWRRPIGCLISQITFRKLATNYRALLRKMMHKDKASYDFTPPCIYASVVVVCESFVVGWLRLAGSLKSQDSFTENCLFYMALLQKRREF